MAMILKTPETFYNTYNGKAIDDDGAYGIQCVDGIRVGCKYLDIPVIPTPNNWADGYWTCLNSDGTPSQRTAEWQEKYFEKIRDPKEYRNGDWVIWGRGSVSHPSSHVAMYYNGMEFGENQGKDRSFGLKATDFLDSLGALRPEAWSRIPAFESEATVNGRHYYLYGQKSGLQAVVLSPGLNRTAQIQDMDCQRWIYLKITGCNFFQNDPNNSAGQPYGMTFGDISSPISGVYQNLPGQDSTMYFDLETGEHGDCTGVNIDPTHNVFSPSLIYQPGKNVQFARMVGLGQRHIRSIYTFLIRYMDGTYAAGLTDQETTPEEIWADFQGLSGVESLSILDGGGSAQMMRYISKENRVEYTRTTPRATAGCIAFVGNKIQKPETPTEPPQEEESPAESNEDKKDEEESMTETKPQEQPEMSPVEGWTDPEPQTGIIVQRIAALLSVKSLITIFLTVIFGLLVLKGEDLPDKFVSIYTMCISFFFGYQFKKAEGSDK